MPLKHAGFTLIEAMTGLTIVALALAFGLPAMGDALQRQRVATALHLIGTDLAMARSSAIAGRGDVVVCPAAGAPLRCREDRNWEEGWMVFRDPDGNRQPDRPDQVLRASRTPAGAARRLILRSTRPFIRYRRDGRSIGTNFSVVVCSETRLAGKVVVSNLGRVRSERPARPIACPVL